MGASTINWRAAMGTVLVIVALCISLTSLGCASTGEARSAPSSDVARERPVTEKVAPDVDEFRMAEDVLAEGEGQEPRTG